MEPSVPPAADQKRLLPLGAVWTCHSVWFQNMSRCTLPELEYIYVFIYLLFFGGTGVWTKDFVLARQVLCCFSHNSSPGTPSVIQRYLYVRTWRGLKSLIQALKETLVLEYTNWLSSMHILKSAAYITLCQAGPVGKTLKTWTQRSKQKQPLFHRTTLPWTFCTTVVMCRVNRIPQTSKIQGGWGGRKHLELTHQGGGTKGCVVCGATFSKMKVLWATCCMPGTGISTKRKASL
jgi:hypothetical protein